MGMWCKTHGDSSCITLYIWKFLREQIWKVLITRKKIVTKYDDMLYKFLYIYIMIAVTYCDHFIIWTNIKSLCCIPETNMLYVNYVFQSKKVQKHPVKTRQKKV